MTEASLTLEITQAPKGGRALVRMPLDKMTEIDAEAGDCLTLHAQRTTHARVIPAAIGDECIGVSDETIRNMQGTLGATCEASRAALSTLRSALIRVTGPNTAKPDDLAEALFDLPLTEGDEMTLSLPLGRTAEIKILNLDPAPAGLFCSQTLLSLAATPPPEAEYDGIGGMQDEIARVHEMVALPLLRPELFQRLGVTPPRGILFTGPPGSGKTLLARAIAARTSAAFFQINGPEIVSKHYGESEAALRAIFQAAEKEAPAIIFVDEIDAIAPRRDTLSGEKQVERRVVAQLLTLMDGLSDRGRIIVMAATNLPDSLDPALRRPGRFDREVGFTPPDTKQREAILNVHLSGAPLSPDVALHEIAAQTHGYLGADLAAVASEASLAALDRTLSQAGPNAHIDPQQLFITHPDLLRGVAATGPSALRDTYIESPRISFDDVGGLEDVKDALHEAILWPLNHREACTTLGLSPAAGVLLTGPPGSGKTLIARALATESGMNFIPVRPARILSQFLGDAERAITEIFNKARQAAPCLVFFDELDTLAPCRGRSDATQDRIVTQILTELDGLSQNVDVVVLAATNRAAAIDPALTRPGRFDVIIPIALPEQQTRLKILNVHCKSLPLGTCVDLKFWAKQTEGATGADLAELLRAAARRALRRSIKTNTPETNILSIDFEQAFAQMKRSAVARTDDYVSMESEV